ncbi:MAG: phenylalanine--tRNA ligase subunit beta, partial [Acidobacteriaceae bacterium]
KESFLRRTLRAAGYTEAISSTFCPAADANSFAPQPNSIVQLGNPLSEEVGFLRPSLFPGMLSMLAHNLNREVDDLRLFEIGTIFTGSSERVQEKPSLVVGATGAAITPHALGSLRDYSFYDLKGIVEELLSGFVTKSMYMDAFSASSGLIPPWLHPGRAARLVVDGETLGFFGELAHHESQSRKLRQTIFLGEFNLARLFQHALRQPAARELSRFPAVVRDFSFTFPDAVRWQQIADTLASLAISEMRSTEPREIFRDKKEQSGSYALLLRVVFQAQDRTLRLEELQEWAHRIFSALMELGGQPRFPLELLS